MNILQLAGSLPRDPQFREWLQSKSPGEWTAGMAATFIRVQCAVGSRRELLDNAEAADAFHNLIRRPFVAWRERQEQTG